MLKEQQKEIILSNMMNALQAQTLNIKKQQESDTPPIDTSANLKLRRTTDRIYRDFSKLYDKKKTKFGRQKTVTKHIDDECCESQQSGSI